MAAVCLLARPAAAQPMLPPVLESEAGYLAGFAEPPLWLPSAMTGYRQRLRLVLAGPKPERIAIRLDTDEAGRIEAYFIRQSDSRGHRRIIDRRRLTVPPAQMGDLDRLIARSKLWKIYPEFWQFPKDQICVDGVNMIFERANAAGYRFSEANAQCTAPSDVLQIAALMIDIADPGDAEVASWLR